MFYQVRFLIRQEEPGWSHHEPEEKASHIANQKHKLLPAAYGWSTVDTNTTLLYISVLCTKSTLPIPAFR